MKLLPLILTVFASCSDIVSAEEQKVPAEMVRIEGGEFTPMFGELEQSRKVESFLIDRRPVTNAEFLEFVRENPQWRRSNAKKLFADSTYLAHWAGDLELGENAPPNAAVVQVSWFAARAYLRTVGKRLLTEDEWEFAALANEEKLDASKDTAFLNRILEWYGKPTPTRLPDVDDLEADVRGVVGLHGNVWEWVIDFNNQMVTGAARNDTSLDRGLFCAGGAVGATDAANYAAFMRYAFRSSLEGNYTTANLGFRGARDAE